jgi:hypothetical protein
VGNIPGLANALQRLLAAPPPLESISMVSNAYSVAAAASGVIAAADWLAGNRKGGRE